MMTKRTHVAPWKLLWDGSRVRIPSARKGLHNTPTGFLRLLSLPAVEGPRKQSLRYDTCQMTCCDIPEFWRGALYSKPTMKPINISVCDLCVYFLLPMPDKEGAGTASPFWPEQAEQIDAVAR